MILRPATIDDSRVLFEWRNDPLTRANSLSTDVVEYASHVAWVERSIAAPDRALYIAVVEIPVGTVRLDTHGIVRELSWTVAPEHRGKGYGKQMAKLAVAMGGPMKAVIKVGNAASMKIAEAAGLSVAREADGLLYYANFSMDHSV